MLIRAAQEADLVEIVALERATAGAPHWSEVEYRAALDLASDVKRCLLVAEIAEQGVGFAVGKVTAAGDEVRAELESVVVASEMRRLGVGRALCTAIEEWCRSEGASSIELEVRAGSAGAIALYESLGFKVAGRRRGYYRGPVDDALLMSKELHAQGVI